MSSISVIGENEIMDYETASPSPSPSSSVLKEDVLYVALGKDEKESETVLRWALKNLNGLRRICVLHVHQPAQRIPTMMGGKFSIGLLDKQEVDAYHESERNNMHKILDKYIRTCNQVAAVQAEKLWVEADSVEKGLVQLISENGVRWLVMGAAANRSYSSFPCLVQGDFLTVLRSNLDEISHHNDVKMKEPKSKTAICVSKEVPSFCHIWFVCKGNIISARKSTADVVDQNGHLPLFQANPAADIPLPRSHSVAEETRAVIRFQDPVREHRRVRSDISSPANGFRWESPQCSFILEGNSGWDNIYRRSPSVISRLSTSSENAEDLTLAPLIRTGRNEFGVDPSPKFQKNDVDHRQSSVASSVVQNPSDELYDRLEQLVTEAESSRKEAYEESIRRRRAEKDVIDAIRRAKTSESMYTEELRHRQEIEEALARGKEEAERLRWKLDELIEELRIVKEDKISLEQQIVDSDKTVQELEQKMYSAVELLQKYKKERDDLQVDYDNALRLFEEVRNNLAEEASSSSASQFFCEFTFPEIKEATSNFNQALKIGEGGYGIIYRGNLRRTDVAIKMLRPNSSQGHLEFQQEVNVLSKLRHPNIITLIGACPESYALIYEYLPQGSLEDRLNCKNNAPPLSWKTRIRIATELCSALIFLHHCQPQGIVHGDLKPANVLLDASLSTKLSDFGICRVLPRYKLSVDDTTRCFRTDPKGTVAYLDPSFLTTGEITSKSDVYAFGIILLRLLTGRPAVGITNEVRDALDEGNMVAILDPTAGDWPFVQAKQLAHVAIRCCDKERSLRPNLVSEVWRVLEPMNVSCGASSLRAGSDERSHVPSYFICPIFQEVMRDPVVAADGFTYEAEAIKGWFEAGHETSPMTNVKLPHLNIVTNHALRSAIQEWLQQF